MRPRICTHFSKQPQNSDSPRNFFWRESAQIDLNDFPDVPSRAFLHKQINEATSKQLALALLVVRRRLRRAIFKFTIELLIFIPLGHLLFRVYWGVPNGHSPVY